jgi:predicted nucleic acid-binding protein
VALGLYIADTDLLSAFIKTDHLRYLYSLFAVETIYITSSVWEELARSPSSSLQLAVEDFLAQKQLEVVELTLREMSFSQQLPESLGPGERDTMAYAKFHQGIVLSNESRVAHWCNQIGVKQVRLPTILRQLWQAKILTMAEVRVLIKLLEERDRMRFSSSTLTAIFHHEE